MIYIYRCDCCSREKEIDHSPSECDSKEVLCDRCAAPMERVITGGNGFILKGNTWYRDGYSGKKSSN
jgi:predicted nucleic acid-binding Zn ribbon protein